MTKRTVLSHFSFVQARSMGANAQEDCYLSMCSFTI